MRLCKNFIKILLIISTFGLSKELNIDLSSSKLSTSSITLTSPSSLLIERQQQQEQNYHEEHNEQEQEQQQQQYKQLNERKLNEQLQQNLQQKQNNFSNDIITKTIKIIKTKINPTSIITTTTPFLTAATTLFDDTNNDDDDDDDDNDYIDKNYSYTETDVNDLFVVNETRDSRSLNRQFFINNQQGANVIRPKDYSYNNNNNNNNKNNHNILYNILNNDGNRDSINNNGIKNYGNFLSTPDDCKTKSGNMGLCMRRFECIINGGSASGFCGTFGVCCEINLQCNGVSKLKRTIIKNPPIIPQQCTYHFQSYNSNVCQLRIDFDMTLAQPTIPDGNNDLESVTCLMDKFSVGNIVICGTNLKQHIYFPFDIKNQITDISIEFKLADRLKNSELSNPIWNMIVTQLECPPSRSISVSSSLSFLQNIFQNNNNNNNNENQKYQQSSPSPPNNGMLSYFTQQYTNLPDLKTLFLRPNYYADVDLLAPPGCLQYFTKRQGTFESFNFNMGKGPYMSNMRYGICFKRTPLDHKVRFSSETFQIGAASDTNNFVDIDCHDIVATPKRSNDYLAIPESVLVSDIEMYGNYYCGTSLMDDIIHAPPGPFVIYFMSDNLFSTLVPEVGFKINYMIQ